METKFEKFLLERKLFNNIFKINPLKEIVLEFLEKEGITTEDMSSETDKYRIYDLYLNLKEELSKKGFYSILREGSAFEYNPKRFESNHFWLECDKWIIDIYPLSAKGENYGAINMFYDNTENQLYGGIEPKYEF